MDIETGKTPIEQDYISFKNKYNEKFTLVAQGEQQLRCAIREGGDTSMHAPFTHFTRDEVKAILPYLQAYAETGTFDLSKQCVESKPMINRDHLGAYVRMIETELAWEQSIEEPPASVTMPYHDLPEAGKERYRRIGEFMANVLLKNHHPLDMYQEEVQRTVGTKGYGDTLAMTSMGLAGETGEVVEHLKKHLWHGAELDNDKLALEVGDVAWYLAAMCNALNISLKDVLEKNVVKLRRRYPSGFSAEKSKNRQEETNGK